MSPVGKGGVYYDNPERAAWADLATQVVAASGVGPVFNVQDADSILGKLIVSALGTNEIQKIVVKATGGTFTISYGGKTTAALKFNATHQEVQTALEGLSSIGTGRITVTGGPGDEAGTAPYVITFIGFGENVAQVTTDATLLTGGEHLATASTTTAGDATGSVKVALETEVNGDWLVVGEFAETTATDLSVGKVFPGLGTKCRWKWTLGAGDGAKFSVQVSARKN